MPSPARMRLAVATVATLASAAGAFWLWSMLRPPPGFLRRVEVRAGAEMQDLVRDGVCVADPVVGHRPRKGVVIHGAMGPLGGVAIPVTRHHNDLGLVRDGDLSGTLTGPSGRPRIVVHGDSHMMGIVSSADNATAVLEGLLRAEKENGLADALVLNAACDNYCLYQYVLRHRQLAPRLAPDVIVVVAYMGNDFLDLEDTRRPHLDDAGVERPAATDPPSETTSARRRALDLDRPDPLGGLFWQGLNQASYFEQRPERLPVIRKKTRRAIRLLQAEAERAKAELVVVLLPTFALVFPERARSLAGGEARAVIDNGAQQAFYAWFRRALAAAEVPAVDLLPALRRDGRPDLFANDLHIWIPAHRLLAETLREALLPILRRRRGG